MRTYYPKQQQVVKSVTIRVNKTHICLPDYEFERIFYLIALINRQERRLRSLNFEYYYYSFLNTMAERMTLDKNYYKDVMSKDTILLFTAEMTVTYAMDYSHPRNCDINSLSLLEIIKFFPKKFVDDVDAQIRKLLQRDEIFV